MSRSASALALAAMAVALLAVPIGSQQRFRSRTDGVRVDVLVTDGSQRLRGLTAGDFELRDNGVVQRISAIDVEGIPLNLICVLDTSDSVAGARLQALAGGVLALVDLLRDVDHASVVSFATLVSIRTPLTSDRAALRRGLTELRAAGLTSLRDATFAGLAIREADPSRTLMLVFSDGEDTSSWLSGARVIDAAKRSDVVVYALRTPPAPPTAPIVDVRDIRPDSMRRRQPGVSISVPQETASRPDRFLQAIAEETGGQLRTAKTDKDLTAAFTAILGEFRERYVLSYLPEGVPSSGWHELSVRVKGRKATVTARRGYFVD